MSESKSVVMRESSVSVDDHLTPKQTAFITEFLIDHNGRQAAIRAGYSEATAQEQSSRLLSNVKVRGALDRRMAAAADAAEVSAALVISELYQVAMADPRELMRVETDCCRHCFGIDHKYHWTAPEYTRALNAALDAGKPAPDIEGGFGFDPRREPHDDCPDCFGRGVERISVTPSRKLSKAAAKLLASIKQAKDGSIELKTRDQDAALIALGRVVGAFKDRQELSGPGGGPLQLQPVPNFKAMTDDELREILARNGGNPPLLEGDSQ